MRNLDLRTNNIVLGGSNYIYFLIFHPNFCKYFIYVLLNFALILSDIFVSCPFICMLINFENILIILK